MKLLFLDFDGVLNSFRPTNHQKDESFLATWSAKRTPTTTHTMSNPLRHLEDLDMDAVAKVNHIVTTSGCKVVVSSTWRTVYSAEDLQWLLEGAGFTGEVIGITKDFSSRPRLSQYISGVRGDEIKAYVEASSGIESYVVLDDHDDVGSIGDRWVRVSNSVGLTDADVEKVLKLFEEAS